MESGENCVKIEGVPILRGYGMYAEEFTQDNRLSASGLRSGFPYT